MTYEERKEFNKLEKEMEKLAKQLKEIGKISGSTGNEGYSVPNDWTTKQTKLKAEIEKKEERWIELSEK
jgi:hypothetical protein